MFALILIILVDLVMMYIVLRVGLIEDHHPVSVTAPSVEAMKARIPAAAAKAQAIQEAEAPAAAKSAAAAETASAASADADE